METGAELERIRQCATSARQRLRRLDVLLDDQMRVLDLDPLLKRRASRGKPAIHAITKTELRLFTIALGVAALGAFLAGFWTARLR